MKDPKIKGIRNPHVESASRKKGGTIPSKKDKAKTKRIKKNWSEDL